MNYSLKIALSSFSILIFTIFLVFLFVTDNSSKSNNVELISSQDFFSQDFDLTKKKIIFVGSSHVARVNATYVQELLVLSDNHFDVFNLGMSGDTPSKRLESIDDLISLKPTIVVYGIGFRDFSEFILKSEIDKPQSVLPDSSQILPQTILEINKSFNINLNNFESPKIKTIQQIKNFLNLSDDLSNSGHLQENTPFYSIMPKYSQSMTDAELKRAFASNAYSLSDIDFNSKNILSLKKIISKFHSNDIPIILYTTPKSKLFLDSMSVENKNLLSSILNDISKYQNIDVHFLHDKYIDEDIWNNNMHIITGSNNVIHNNDLADIIINFLDK
jgi:hypothetical protein